MPRLIGNLVSLALVSFVAADAARAGVTVPHRERCSGVLNDITADSMAFTGLGNATHFGRYRIVGSHGYDALGNIFDGQFTSILADGSQISGVYSGTFEVLASGKSASTCTCCGSKATAGWQASPLRPTWWPCSTRPLPAPGSSTSPPER